MPWLRHHRHQTPRQQCPNWFICRRARASADALVVFLATSTIRLDASMVAFNRAYERWSCAIFCSASRTTCVARLVSWKIENGLLRCGNPCSSHRSIFSGCPLITMAGTSLWAAHRATSKPDMSGSANSTRANVGGDLARTCRAMSPVPTVTTSAPSAISHSSIRTSATWGLSSTISIRSGAPRWRDITDKGTFCQLKRIRTRIREPGMKAQLNSFALSWCLTLIKILLQRLFA